MVIDTTYQLRPGETTDAYTTRIDAYNASKHASSPVKPVGILSTDNAATTVQTKQNSLASMTPVPPATPSKTGSETTTTPAKTSSLTLVNPETKQTLSFDDPAINRDNIQSWMSQGYVVQEGSNTPSWLSSVGGTATDTNAAQTALDEAQKEVDGYTAQLQKYMISDPELASQLAGITQMFEARKQQMEDVNRRRAQSLETTGVRLGSRYTGGKGGVFGGIVAEEERQGIMRLAELDSQMQAAINGARQAQRENNWKIFATQVEMAEKKRAEKAKIVDELNKQAVEQAKKLEEEKRAAERDVTIEKLLNAGVTEPADILAGLNEYGIVATAKQVGDALSALQPDQKAIVDLAKDAKKNGAPPEVIQAILQGGTVENSLTASGDWLQAPAGMAGEYLFYKRAEEQAGRPAVDFNTYQNQDANRKIRIQQAANAAGLTQVMMSTAMKLSDDYEQRSKDFYTVRDAYNRILASAGDPSAAGDLALIFSYMKVLDPGSTVREGEFANAQNAGSAFERVGALYNKVATGQRLTETQRKDFVDRSKRLFDAAQTQQQQTVKEFAGRSDKYGVPVDLVIRSTEPNPGQTSAGEIASMNEQQAQTAVKSYLERNPIKKVEVRERITSIEKTLGRKATYAEFLQAFPEYAK